MIKNADFSNGNVDFYSDYPFVTNISTQGVFGINTSAMNLNPVFFDDCPDHTSGTGQMMVVDGSPVANERVWCQTIDILPNRTYAFSAWLTSVKRENPAMLRFSINGLPIGQIFSASPITCEWKQFYELWNSESATTADICIVNQNTNPDGNDFALDDFAFFELEEIEADTFVIIVEALVAAERKNVFIPNAFSPNDDGINDLFEIYLGKGAESIESLSIYDRWGNKMLDYQDCFLSENCRWDGTFNGNRVNGGTYIYSTVVNFVNGNTEHFSGTILLSR